MKTNNPITPGRILLEEYLKSMGILTVVPALPAGSGPFSPAV